MLRLTFKIKKDITKNELLTEVCNKNKINIKSLLVRCERKFDIVISLSTVKTLSNYLTR